VREIEREAHTQYTHIHNLDTNDKTTADSAHTHTHIDTTTSNPDVG
jgi:hypothetical protein